ncbi:YecA family protein [Candidatus Latescibacterota bacterium]
MVIVKSEGLTSTERQLTSLCERSFLKLWSYPNPFKDDRKELCDLLAVFENHVFIFFARENLSLNKKNKDPMVNWTRWKKKTIDNQTRTAHGAEKYIKSGRDIFLDKNLEVLFPIDFDREKMVVHKIIIAHGAKEACEKFSDENIYGSLGVSYDNLKYQSQFPFTIKIAKEKPVHVFDSHNLPIVLGELDTFFDFSSYLDAKIEAINSLEMLSYCGEEDLLAHYFQNFDETRNKHYIGTTLSDKNSIMIGEGAWKDFSESEVYRNRKKMDKVSYLWDDIIQRTCDYTLNDKLIGDSTPLRGPSAIHEMAKEPRFTRRGLSKHMVKVIQNFPESSHPIVHHMSFMPSFYKGKGYVFLQLKVDGITDYENEYRPKRQAMLEIACGAAKNKFDHMKKVIGIAIDSPKFTEKNSEDLLLLECDHWPDDLRKEYEEANKGLKFFNTGNLTMHQENFTEFPNVNESNDLGPAKIGRNELCPCGSGRKYKKCCIDVKLI